MFEKEYMKNLTKLKNKLQVQNNRPTFLQDENWTSSQKSQPQGRKSYKPKYECKDSKIFDLQQIKKQLGLFELRNTVPQETQNVSKIEKVNLYQVPSFKNQKQQIKENPKKKSSHKSSKVLIRQEPKVEENGGFTERINQLVKLRVQHQNIINSLVKKKVSNISTEQQSLSLQMNKNHSYSSGYIKVSHQYEVHSPQKSQIQSKRFEKHKNPPPKLELDTGTFNYSKNMKKVFTFQKQPQQMKQNPANLTQKNEVKNTSQKNYKRTYTEKQILTKEKQQIRERSTLTQPHIQSKHHSKQVSRISQPISQNMEELQPINELNENKFQMQHHVNLLASLSQFEFTNRQKTQNKDSVQIQNQLYQSIQMFIQKNILRSQKFPYFHSNQKSQIHITYAGIDQNYQNYHLLIKGLRRIKEVSKEFIKVVEYLTQNQVWQGLFRSEQKRIVDEKNKTIIKKYEYHGLCFDSGNYIQLLLSGSQLSETQRKLLMLNFQQDSMIICDFSLILLSRLINLQINKYFPEMLNRLFGYQFIVFNIEKLIDFTDCMDFIDRLREIHNKQLRNKGGLIVENNEDGSFKQRYSLSQIQEQEQTGQIQNQSILQDVQKHCDFQLFGYNKTNQQFQLITPYFFSQKNKTVQTIQLYEFRELMRHEKYTKKLSQSYNKLSIINKKQLPVKSINLKHYSNHFVVVSINVMEEGLYFLSVGQKIEKSTQNIFTKISLKYRLCLISSNSKTILQCLILERNESYPVYLPKQEFQVYISAYESQNQLIKSETSYKKQRLLQKKQQQHLNFTFYIQSHHIIARSMQKISKRQLQLELRLKEQYQSYTSMIVEQFIEFSFLEKQITKFFSEIHQLNQNKTLDETKTQQNTFGQQNNNGVNKNQDPEKSQSKMTLENLDLKSQESYTMLLNNRNNKIHNDFSSESRVLRLSLDNQNAFQTQEWKNQQQSQIKLQENEGQYIIFQDLQIQPSIRLANILRIHLKALDLYIDCIDTTQIQNKETQNQPQITIKYNQKRVLCDLNYHKNTATLRPDSINLIYLTKDPEIKQIKIQKQSNKKIKNQTNQSKFEIKYRMFRKEW